MLGVADMACAVLEIGGVTTTRSRILANAAFLRDPVRFRLFALDLLEPDSSQVCVLAALFTSSP